ncbi:hypothetical protein ACOMHN_031651 [Nucella lapillus]
MRECEGQDRSVKHPPNPHCDMLEMLPFKLARPRSSWMYKGIPEKRQTSSADVPRKQPRLSMDTPTNYRRYCDEAIGAGQDLEELSIPPVDYGHSDSFSFTNDLSTNCRSQHQRKEEGWK